MKQIVIPLAVLMLAACASKPPQQMTPRELAKCAWNGNADCRTELQRRLSMKQGAMTTSSPTVAGTPH